MSAKLPCPQRQLRWTDSSKRPSTDTHDGSLDASYPSGPCTRRTLVDDLGLASQLLDDLLEAAQGASAARCLEVGARAAHSEGLGIDATLNHGYADGQGAAVQVAVLKIGGLSGQRREERRVRGGGPGGWKCREECRRLVARLRASPCRAWRWRREGVSVVERGGGLGWAWSRGVKPSVHAPTHLLPRRTNHHHGKDTRGD